MGSLHSNPELLERRKQMIEGMALSNNIIAVSTALSAKFLVPAGTIAADWFRREKWIDKLIELGDSEALFLEDLRELSGVIEKAVNVFDSTKSDHVKAHMLRIVRDTVLTRQDLYERIGLKFSVGEDSIADDKKEADDLLAKQKLSSPLKAMIPGSSGSDSEEKSQSEESDE